MSTPQEVKNKWTSRFAENHERKIEGVDLQEMVHDVVDMSVEYTNENQAADKNFVHDQGTPATEWNIEHNLGKKPSVVVYDSAGTQVIGSVKYIDDNNVTITFSAAFSGKATLN